MEKPESFVTLSKRFIAKLETVLSGDQETPLSLEDLSVLKLIQGKINANRYMSVYKGKDTE